MPELPEVETIKLGVTPHLLDKEIKDVIVNRRDLRWPIPKNFENTVSGQKVLRVARRSKYLKLYLANGYVVVLHFGMSGRLRIKERPAEYIKHDHVVFQTSLHDIIFNDPRRFGAVTVEHSHSIETHKLFKNIGEEPFDISGADFYRLFSSRKCSLKSALLNQKLIAGVGNIYACEALFESKLMPTRGCESVGEKSYKVLLKNIQSVLRSAIASGGSSLRDYRQASGETGYFQHEFKVYGRAGESCFKCGCVIKKVVQNQRSSFFCPKCQS